MLSAAGGRTPEVWNLSYANPHHGSLVNGNGGELLAEEGELLPRQGCTQPAMQHVGVAATAHGYAFGLSLDCDRRPSNFSPAGAITLESVSTWQ
jgi:hypothetical protein